MIKYYTQPFNVFALVHGREFTCKDKCEGKKFAHPGNCPICNEKLEETKVFCNLQQSIAQRIHLILITNFNEFRYDNKFGCIIWEHDFENVPNISKWKDSMAKAVKEELEQYEKRLQNIKTSLELTEEEFRSKDKDVYRKIKRRVDIKINANLKLTNEPFFFQELLYVSPIWIE